MSLKLMYITNNPNVALIAEKNGVDRVWVDLETFGKEERQKHMNTVKSKHSVADIRRIAPLLTTAEMLVRVNSWNDNSVQEIKAVIDAGADIIMLPMWKSASEVTNFINAIEGKCKTILLLETKEAVECLDEVLKIDGIDEIHIGLNDLHLSYKMTFMFELLSNGTVEKICEKIKAAGIPYGFGGVSSLGTGEIPAEKIIMEHYRIGSTMAILSRSFCDTELISDLGVVDKIFSKYLFELRRYEETLISTTEERFMENKKDVLKCVEKIVKTKKRERDV